MTVTLEEMMQLKAMMGVRCKFRHLLLEGDDCIFINVSAILRNVPVSRNILDTGLRARKVETKRPPE